MNPVLILPISVFFQISLFVTNDRLKQPHSFLTNIPFIVMLHAFISDTLIKPYIGVCVHKLLLTDTYITSLKFRGETFPLCIINTKAR